MYVPASKIISLQCLSMPSCLFKANVFPNSLPTSVHTPHQYYLFPFLTTLSLYNCLKTSKKQQYNSLLENTLRDVCKVVLNNVVWLWSHFCKVWMLNVKKKNIWLWSLSFYMLSYILFQENSKEFYIFIAHMLKCYVFSFSREINNSRIYILRTGGKHPWSCLLFVLPTESFLSLSFRDLW